MEIKKISILFIDVFPENLFALKSLLAKSFSDAQVFTAIDAGEGLKMANDKNPDVILLDLDNDVKHGIEVCRQIKSNAELVSIPVVFITSQEADDGYLMKALNAGGEGFITKPFKQAALATQLSAMVTIKHGRIKPRLQEVQLSKLVDEQTRDLKVAYKAILSVLDELKKEIEVRKKIEEELKVIQQRYSAFIETSMDAILLTKPDGSILSANAAACEMFGRTEEEFKTLGRDCIIDKSDERYLSFVEARRRMGKTRVDLWLVRKNGEPFFAEVSSSIYCPRADVEYSSMIIRDASMRVEAERTIENERLLLRTLINNIPDSIYCKDLALKKTIANKTDIKYMGAKSETEVIGKSDFDFYPKELAERFYADDRLVLEDGKPLVNREEVVYDEQGRRKWLLSSKLPLRDRNNKIIGLVGIGRDITELKQREQVLRLQYNMAQAKAHRKNLQELFDGIRNDLGQLMESDNLTLAMLQPETGMLYSPVDYEDNTQSPDTWPADKSLTGWLLKQGKSCILTRPELEQLVAEENLLRYGPASKSWMGVPLFDQEEVVGAIIIQSYKNQHAYSKDNLMVVELIASQLIDYMKRLEAEQLALKLTKAVEQSPGTIMITNTQGVIEYINPKFTEHTGYAAEEAIGQTPAILTSGKHPKAYYKSIWESLRSGKDWSGEILNRRKDGSLYWENTSIAPLINNSGDITHYIAVKEEITEKKETEAALKYHTELQSMLIKIASGYINVNVDNIDATIQSSLEEMGRFAAADRAYIFEYDWEKRIASNSYEWCDDGVEQLIGNFEEIDLAAVEKFVEAFTKGEVIYVSDLHSMNVNEELDATIAARGIKSGIGLPLMDGEKCLGFVGFDWVNKEHKYQEGEKVLLSIFSQLLVNVRLKSKLEQKLIIQKEKAEAASRLKTAFLNNISHEVRTPINGILGFGRMLVEPGITQHEKKEYYDVLQESCDRLVRTITSFMDISLLTSGNMAVVEKKFSLHYFLKRLFKHYKNRNTNFNVKLKLELKSNKDDLLITTDEELLRKLFYHILENAFKFTPEGIIKMGYVYRKNRIEFFVSDTGIGIDPEILSTIYEPFFQEDSRLSRGYEGSGLGLSISKGLAELLGGSLSIKSEKGSGTSVFFSIPHKGAARQIPVETPEMLCEEDVCILIAEDDAINKLYLETFLRHEGFNLISVENGKQAVDACLSNQKIKVVLMDLKMPVMGGIEATRQIKKQREDLAVIAVTAHGMNGDREVALDAGCDDYLSKPFNKDVLISKIKFYLNDFFENELLESPPSNRL